MSPYAVKGDTGGDYETWTPSVGQYSLIAIPYSGPNGTGDIGTPLTLNFSVHDDSVLPTLDSVEINGTPIPPAGTFTINQSFVNSNPTNTLVLKYSEEMDTAVIPVLSIVPSTVGLINCQPIGWNNPVNDEYTFNCTLNSGIAIEIPGLTITASGAEDLAGNPQQNNFVSTNQLAVDTKSPLVTFKSLELSPTNKQPIHLTATVSENTNNPLAETDFTITNGTIVIGSFIQNGNVYTFVVNPLAEGKVGVEVAAGTITDLAGNLNLKSVFEIDYDTTAPASVSNLKISLNSAGQPVLTWANPPAGTYAGLKVVRDGAFLMTLDPTATSFTDMYATPGETYSYEIVAYDNAGNETTVAPVSITIPALTGITAPANEIASAAISDTAAEIVQAPVTGQDGDVKANESDEEKDNNNLPLWGIILLFILAIIGGYLVYTQRPGKTPIPPAQSAPKPRAPRKIQKK